MNWAKSQNKPKHNRVRWFLTKIQGYPSGEQCFGKLYRNNWIAKHKIKWTQPVVCIIQMQDSFLKCYKLGFILIKTPVLWRTTSSNWKGKPCVHRCVSDKGLFFQITHTPTQEIDNYKVLQLIKKKSIPYHGRNRKDGHIHRKTVTCWVRKMYHRQC